MPPLDDQLEIIGRLVLAALFGGISRSPLACTCLPVHSWPTPEAPPPWDGRVTIRKKSSVTGTEDFWLRGTTLIPPPEAEALGGLPSGRQAL